MPMKKLDTESVSVIWRQHWLREFNEDKHWPSGHADTWKGPTEIEAKKVPAKIQSPLPIIQKNYNGTFGFATQQYNEAGSVKKFSGRSNLRRRIATNVAKTFKDYCDYSTLHGLKYIGDTSLNYMQRLFWVIAFVCATMGTSYFIWRLYNRYSQTPIIISRSSEAVSINEIPFPAVTVCNMNNAKRSVAEKIIEENDPLQKFYLEDICNFKNGTFQFFQKFDGSKEAGSWESIYQFLLNVSQSCSQMMYYCEWSGNETSCSELFNPVLTDEGLCCRFNVLPDLLYYRRTWENLDVSSALNHIEWDPEYKFTPKDHPDQIPWRAYASGSTYGLTLALDVAADEYFCSSTASVGFKMLLHSPVEMPQIADFAFTLSPGKETRVIITPHIADADISIIKIPVKIRRCYFLGEKNLKYYKIYTQRNCVLECEANFTLQYCQCMEYYMPVTSNTRICGKNDDLCTDIAKKIMKNKWYEDDDVRAAYNITKAPSCKCYPGCNEINYSTEISQSMLMTTFYIPEEIYKFDSSYFTNNVAIVHIFYIDTSYLKYTKNVIYGFAELLSNTGGILGLFLGFSLLSVVEIFYFSTRLVYRILNHTTPKS
ncbi:pickpocket protein 28-like, partial [Copidosoma floridanum]|uniref:pickpocket protein 28-like n=1 Tax=Copidosoma floridanum TaxID=29053 RepID=UPI000C6F56C9